MYIRLQMGARGYLGQGFIPVFISQIEVIRMSELSYLSLGWGVQSWTIAAMMALQYLPRADFLIHADTNHERSSTYDFARRLTPWLGEHGLTVVTVSGKRTEVVVESWGSVMIPAYTKDNQTAKPGVTRRQCTHDWKITPMRSFIRAELARRNVKIRPGLVDAIQGISLDEWHRTRDSDVKYINNVYPLVDRRITRADCISWLEAHDLEVPEKSSCTFCPYRSIVSWKDLKRAGGADWNEALEVDQAIRRKRPKAELFVHPNRRPLEEAVSIPEDEGAFQYEIDFEHPCDSGVCFT